MNASFSPTAAAVLGRSKKITPPPILLSVVITPAPLTVGDVAVAVATLDPSTTVATIRHQWTLDGAPVGDDAATLAITAEMAGRRLRVVATAGNAGGAVSLSSDDPSPLPAPSAPVFATPSAATVSGRRVVIDGGAADGEPTPAITLTALAIDGADARAAATGTGPWTLDVPSSTADRTVAWTVTAANGVSPDATSRGSATVAADLRAPQVSVALAPAEVFEGDVVAASGGDVAIVPTILDAGAPPLAAADLRLGLTVDGESRALPHAAAAGTTLRAAASWSHPTGPGAALSPATTALALSGSPLAVALTPLPAAPVEGQAVHFELTERQIADICAAKGIARRDYLDRALLFWTFSTDPAEDYEFASKRFGGERMRTDARAGTAVGHDTAHVYVTPGTHAVSVGVWFDGELVAEGDGTVAIAPVGSRYAAAATGVLDASATPDWTLPGVPAHDPANRFTTLTAAIDWLADVEDRRLSIRRGTTLRFEGAINGSRVYGWQPAPGAYIDAYGTGDRPLVVLGATPGWETPRHESVADGVQTVFPASGLVSGDPLTALVYLDDALVAPSLYTVTASSIAFLTAPAAGRTLRVWACARPFARQTFTGDGATRTFNLSFAFQGAALDSVSDVFVDRRRLVAAEGWATNGARTQVIFNEAPPAGALIEVCDARSGAYGFSAQRTTMFQLDRPRVTVRDLEFRGNYSSADPLRFDIRDLSTFPHAAAFNALTVTGSFMTDMTIFRCGANGLAGLGNGGGGGLDLKGDRIAYVDCEVRDFREFGVHLGQHDRTKYVGLAILRPDATDAIYVTGFSPGQIVEQGRRVGPMQGPIREGRSSRGAIQKCYLNAPGGHSVPALGGYDTQPVIRVCESTEPGQSICITQNTMMVGSGIGGAPVASNPFCAPDYIQSALNWYEIPAYSRGWFGPCYGYVSIGDVLIDGKGVGPVGRLGVIEAGSRMEHYKADRSDPALIRAPQILAPTIVWRNARPSITAPQMDVFFTSKPDGAANGQRLGVRPSNAQIDARSVTATLNGAAAVGLRAWRLRVNGAWVDATPGGRPYAVAAGGGSITLTWSDPTLIPYGASLDFHLHATTGDGSAWAPYGLNLAGGVVVDAAQAASGVVAIPVASAHNEMNYADADPNHRWRITVAEAFLGTGLLDQPYATSLSGGVLTVTFDRGVISAGQVVRAYWNAVNLKSNTYARNDAAQVFRPAPVLRNALIAVDAGAGYGEFRLHAGDAPLAQADLAPGVVGLALPSLLPTAAAAAQVQTPQLHRDFRGAARLGTLRVGAFQPDSVGVSAPLPAAPVVALAWSRDPVPGDVLGSIGGTDGTVRLAPTITQGWPAITTADLRARYFVNGREVRPGVTLPDGAVLTANVRAPSVYDSPQAMVFAAPAKDVVSASAAFIDHWLENNKTAYIRGLNNAPSSIAGPASLAGRFRLRPGASGVNEDIVMASGLTTMRLQLRGPSTLRAVWRIGGTNHVRDVPLSLTSGVAQVSVLMRVNPAGATADERAELWINGVRQTAPSPSVTTTGWPVDIRCDLFAGASLPASIPNIGMRGWIGLWPGLLAYADFFDPTTHAARNLLGTGTVQGVGPLMYLAGRTGFDSGTNAGSAGRDALGFVVPGWTLVQD